MASGKEVKFRIQELQGLKFYRNDKQKILYDFFSIMFNCLKVIYSKITSYFLPEYSEVPNLNQLLLS